MSRRPSAASWFSRASVFSAGALLVLACWPGCELDRTGLSSGITTQPTSSGGHGQSPLGSGGAPGTGGLSVHFGSGGTSISEHPTGGTIGTSTGGSVLATGGTGTAGQGTGGPILGSGGGAGRTPATGGGAGQSRNGGAGGAHADGRGGATTGSGGWWNWGGNGGGTWTSGTGGWNWGTGGSTSLPMCDASIRDKDTCDFGAADCRKTCGVSELATKPCTCTNRQWDCGDCAYPSGDYSCYELPASGPVPPCPPNTVNGMTSCTGNCTVCANYMDTTGTAKMGYCACNQDPGDNQRLYHCASTAEWPPQ